MVCRRCWRQCIPVSCYNSAPAEFLPSLLDILRCCRHRALGSDDASAACMLSQLRYATPFCSNLDDVVASAMDAMLAKRGDKLMRLLLQRLRERTDSAGRTSAQVWHWIHTDDE